MLLGLVNCANQQKCQGPLTSLRTCLSTHPDQRGPLVAPVCSVSLPQELSPPIGGQAGSSREVTPGAVLQQCLRGVDG